MTGDAVDHAIDSWRTRQARFQLAVLVVAIDRKKPTSVYFGYPDADYQVEVFAPSEATARTLVLTGRITPVDADAGSA